MFAYELHRLHHSELLREAAAQRLSREAAEAGRAPKGSRRFGRRSAGHDSEGRVGAERGRFARAA
ncbi:hypothetical protein J7E93_01085 [Streptomyces sp. ISL-36]|uniref:hypothetical protein n=1 Tax=Streptomyces sp. ISL-36 TaxID=2819182 RepID=UPI001BE76764|nr:hypothetical protein [Streptomyces sp. ISL-36]MBT2438742.1 hypothetical protein [Streptomyces sp. ISL-36]